MVPLLRERHFKFRGGLLPCFYAHYNVTWCNERAVEVPLGQWYLEQAAPEAGRVLEVGHVLGHYGNHDHAVLDKYETAAGVINEDITTWQTEERFDLILSISPLNTLALTTMPRAVRRIKFSPPSPPAGNC